MNQYSHPRFVEPDAELDACARIVVDAAYEVHRAFGPGFPEGTYEQALATELSLRRVPFKRQVPIAIRYKDTPAGQMRLDLLVSDRLIVELKTVETLLSLHRAQVLSYLRATGHPLGLLINFNVRFLRDGVTRIIRGQWD